MLPALRRAQGWSTQGAARFPACYRAGRPLPSLLRAAGRAHGLTPGWPGALVAEKNGWSYEVQEYHNPNKARPKRYIGYGDK